MTALRISKKGRKPGGPADVPRAKYPAIWKMYQEGTCAHDIGVFAGIRRNSVYTLLKRIKADMGLLEVEK